MANYRVIGNASLSEIIGGKKNAERILKSMNYCKEIAVLIGAEYDPPYIWNKNMPKSWTDVIAGKVSKKIKEDIKWKPDAEFIDVIRKELKNET